MKHLPVTRSAGRRGFTLIELMIVVAIISLLMAVSIGVSRGILRSVYEKQTQVMLTALTGRIAQYRQQRDEFPAISSPTATADLLRELRKLQGSRIEDEIGRHFINSSGQVIDAWGQQVEYYRDQPPTSRSMARSHWLEVNKVPLLISRGPDATWDTGDDVMNP